MTTSSGRTSKKGGALIESVMMMPLILSLLIGTIELARVFYTYYTLEKVMADLARYIGTQQGVNFCDGTDATVAAAKNMALTGTTDGSGTPIVPNLTIDQIQIRIERFQTATSDLAECGCDATSCDIANGGQGPDWVVVSIADGYPIKLVFWGLAPDPFPLRPSVRLPFTGT